jgi:hypothetical protein
MQPDLFMNLIIVVHLVFALIWANVSQLEKVTAETGIGKDVFKVTVTLFGITNSTKDISTLVNVKDQTKVKLFDAENPEGKDNDTVSYTMTFPDLQVNDGESYTVCTLSVEGFELNCIEGNNAPFNRPEFVDINLSEGGSGNEGQDPDEGQDENEGDGDGDGNEDEED